MPAPGTLTEWAPPSGPGIRIDSGYEKGETIPGSFDSLVAKLIVTGKDRTQAIERSRRALSEFRIEGMPPALTFDEVVPTDPPYVGASTPPGAGHLPAHPTRITTDFDNHTPPYPHP